MIVILYARDRLAVKRFDAATSKNRDLPARHFVH
jgi:hypothetical protein